MGREKGWTAGFRARLERLARKGQPIDRQVLPESFHRLGSRAGILRPAGGGADGNSRARGDAELAEPCGSSGEVRSGSRQADPDGDRWQPRRAPPQFAGGAGIRAISPGSSGVAYRRAAGPAAGGGRGRGARRLPGHRVLRRHALRLCRGGCGAVPLRGLQHDGAVLSRPALDPGAFSLCGGRSSDPERGSFFKCGCRIFGAGIGAGRSETRRPGNDPDERLANPRARSLAVPDAAARVCDAIEATLSRK